MDLKSPCVAPKQPTPIHQPVPNHPIEPVLQSRVSPGSVPPNSAFGFSRFTSLIKEHSSKVMQHVATLATNQTSPTAESPKPVRPEPPTKPPPPADVKPHVARPPPPPPRPQPPPVQGHEAKPTRPPPPPKPEPPASVQDIKSSFFSHLDWSEDTGETHPAVVNDLLNLSLDGSRPQAHSTANLDPLLTDQSNSRIASNVTPYTDSVDLLGGNSPAKMDAAPRPKSNSIDLLNDIFTNSSLPQVNTPIGSSVDQSNKTEQMPIPTLFPSPSAHNSVPNNLHRNVSTPNLTQTDPLAQLDSFVSSSNTSSAFKKPTSVPLQPTPTGCIPRVASYSAFQSTGPKQPDYSRSYFSDATAATPNPTGTGPKVSANEFQEFLPDFAKKTEIDPNAPIGKLQKDEMVSMDKCPYPDWSCC